jgi:class 3 adenylate cyclase
MPRSELWGKRGVLLALLGQPPMSGYELCAAISEGSGRRCTPGRLLPELVTLEHRGLLEVDRSHEPYRYGLTEQGAEAALSLGPARPQPAVLVMADLVGFTSFTERHGDRAAHEQASRLTHLARTLVAPVRGSLVKSLGDGVLLALPAGADPLPLVRALAAGLAEGEPCWRLHAGAHAGSPVRSAGDLFGRDVNLVARLCDRAGVGELLLSAVDGDEALQLDGMDDAVRVRRVPL